VKPSRVGGLLRSETLAVALEKRLKFAPMGLVPALVSRDDYTSASTAPVLADVTIEA